MPIAVSYPGVYVEEISSGVHTITGVATSITAFVGRTRRGPLDDPVRVQSYAEFERKFGGLWSESTLSYAVAQFFQNGGGDALIVRVAGGAGLKVSTAASVKSLKSDPAGPASAGTGALALDAASSGIWGDALWARIEPVPGDATNKVFNLTVLDNSSGTSEQFLNLSTDPAAPRFVTGFLEQNSNLVRVNGAVPATLVAGVVTDADANKPAILDPKLSSQFANGNDGDAITDDLISKVDLQANKQGIWALEKADLFNLLCIPPLKADTDIGLQTRDAAATYCKQRRALLVVDPLIAWNSHSKAIEAIGKPGFMARNSYAALFFPFVRAPDPGLKGQIASFAPCGAVAGIFARTDADARRVEGAGRHSRPRSAGVRAWRQADRRRERRSSTRSASTACAVPGLSARWSGARAPSTGADQTGGRVQVHPGAAPRAVHRGEPVSRHAMGRVRAERRAAVVADPAERRRFHARPVPPGRLPGHHAAARPISSSATRRRRPQNDINLGIVNIVGRLRAAQAGRVRDHPDPADRRRRSRR